MDGAGQILRDPRTKLGGLARSSKHTSNSPSVLHVISRFSCHRHNILHHLLFYTRYLLTGTNSSTDFFTERLQIPRMCARTSSDRFFLVASHCGRSWSPSMRETEQCHLLPTQQAVSRACGRCPDDARSAARSLFVIGTSCSDFSLSVKLVYTFPFPTS